MSFENLGEESISVTFGNGVKGGYSLDYGEKYFVKAQNLAEEVLLGREGVDTWLDDYHEKNSWNCYIS